MRLTIFALILLFPITTLAEESPRWVWYTEYYQQQVSNETDKQLKNIKKSLKELERRLEERQRRQQQYPIKK